MRPFGSIYAEAAERKGGVAALEAILATTASRRPDEIAAVPDDRVPSEMTRRIFHAGISWDLVDGRWPAIEQVSSGIRPGEVRLHVRRRRRRADGEQGHHPQRGQGPCRADQRPSRARRGSRARERGALLADWPDRGYVDLLALLRDRASHLGGHAAGRFLRAIGKPAFITSPDMVAALIREGVVARPPGGKRDMATVQAAFDAWSEESGRDLTEISRVLSITA